jgi:Domain of Unknown Function (DUF928)
MIQLFSQSQWNLLGTGVTLISLLIPLGINSAPGFAVQRSSSTALGTSTVEQQSTRASRRNRLVFRLTKRKGVPGSRESGATRTLSCVQSGKKLTTFVPLESELSAGAQEMKTLGIGDTLAAYPTFSLFIPSSNATTAEFILFDTTGATRKEQYKEVYSQTLPLTQTGGVTSFQIANQPGVPPLEIGRDYHWSFTLICDPDDPSGYLTAEGRIRRIAPSTDLVSKLQTALPESKPALYAEAGLWYEAVASLVELRRQQPQDPIIKQDWLDFLGFVQLPQLANEPTIACCKAQ